jgi:hypothetical protein
VITVADTNDERLAQLEADLVVLRRERLTLQRENDALKGQVQVLTDPARLMLQAQCLALVTQWYEAADAEHENSNTQYASALDQCADDLKALLPAPVTKNQTGQELTDFARGQTPEIPASPPVPHRNDGEK